MRVHKKIERMGYAYRVRAYSTSNHERTQTRGLHRRNPRKDSIEMKITYRAKRNGEYTGVEDSQPSKTWTKLQNLTGENKVALIDKGWKVSRHVDVSDGEEAIVVAVANEVIGPKKVGLIRGLGRLLGL